VAFVSCRQFSILVTGSAFLLEKDSDGGKSAFVEVCLRLGMVHGTHCKCHGPGRQSGGGTFGFFCGPRVVLVTGDLVPLGNAWVSVEVGYFFGRVWSWVGWLESRSGIPVYCLFGFP